MGQPRDVGSGLKSPNLRTDFNPSFYCKSKTLRAQFSDHRTSFSSTRKKQRCTPDLVNATQCWRKSHGLKLKSSGQFNTKEVQILYKGLPISGIATNLIQ